MYYQSEPHYLKDLHKSFPANSKIAVLGVEFEFRGRAQVQKTSHTTQ